MTPFVQDADLTIHVGDALEVLRSLPDESVHCALTSPPFFGLRDYGVEGQIGLEATPEEWCARLVEVFREVRRVLRADGTCWIESGDSYCANTQGSPKPSADTKGHVDGWVPNSWGGGQATPMRHPTKPKDLLGQPWLLAFALRADGWYLRQCIVWHKPNAMPESAKDRCTTAHSYVFLLSKSARYFFDGDAIAEPAAWERWGDQTVPKYEGTDTASGWMQPKTKTELHEELKERRRGTNGYASGGLGDGKRFASETGGLVRPDGMKNARSVWTIPTQGYAEAHFATWPEALVERILKAGTSERGCCPECGAPWAREVEQGPAPPEPEHRNPAKRLEPGQAGNVGAGNMGFRASRLSGQEMQRWKAAHPDTTIGWRPSCDHADLAPVPCVVLDCFLGSGTTALVARRHGRRCIGIELSPEYARLAADRTRQLSLLAVETA